MTESGKKLQNIFIECNTDTDHPSLLDILIKDTGKGIAKKDLDKIFNEGFSTKQNNSHGVGLSIVKRVIDNHNGSIDVSSIIDQGTEICIKLPIIINAEKPIKIEQLNAQPVSDNHILFVDDETQLLRVLKQFFEFHRYQVHTFLKPVRPYILLSIQESHHLFWCPISKCHK